MFLVEKYNRLVLLFLHVNISRTNFPLYGSEPLEFILCLQANWGAVRVTSVTNLLGLLLCKKPSYFSTVSFIFLGVEEDIAHFQFMKFSFMQCGLESIFTRSRSLPVKLPSLLTTGVSSRLSLTRKQGWRKLQIFDRD